MPRRKYLETGILEQNFSTEQETGGEKDELETFSDYQLL